MIRYFHSDDELAEFVATRHGVDRASVWDYIDSRDGDLVDAIETAIITKIGCQICGSTKLKMMHVDGRHNCRMEWIPAHVKLKCSCGWEHSESVEMD